MKAKKLELTAKSKKVVSKNQKLERPRKLLKLEEIDTSKDKNSNISNYRYEILQKNLEKIKTKKSILRKGSINATDKKLFYKKPLLIVIFIALAIFLSTGFLIYRYIYTPLNAINNSVNNIEANAYGMIEEFNKKDLSNIDTRFGNIQDEIDKVDSQINKFEFLKNYKYTKGYYENLQIGRNILKKTDALLVQTLPELKNVLNKSGFKVEQGDDIIYLNATTGSENGENEEPSALNLVLEEMPLYLELYEKTEPQIIDIFSEIKKINPEYVPSIGGKDSKEKFNEINSFIDEFPELSSKTQNLLKYVPDLIGANGESARYLLILQNETEMRSSGGLITAYGYTTFKDGQLEDIELTDILNMQNDLWSTKYPMPRYNIYGQLTLMGHNCGGSEARVQDLGLYPDIYVTIRDFEEYYALVQPFYPEAYPEYDHILVINHHFAQKLMELVQPLSIEGHGEVTASNLFDFIKLSTDDPANAYSSERKGIVKDIANVAKDKFVELPLSDTPKIINTLLNAFLAKDIAVVSKDPQIQEYLDGYDLSGRMVNDFPGDYFNLSEAQNCSLKLNKWVKDTVYQDIYINEDGSIRKEVKVKWRQPQFYDPSLSKHYDEDLSHRYRAWVRIIAPAGVPDFDSDGYSKSGYIYYWPFQYYDEIMNKEVSDNIIMFDHRRFTEEDPIEKQELNVNYSLPANINYNNDGGYKLLIQKHPGKSWENNMFEDYVINIHHKDKTYTTNFSLERDKVITYKNGIIAVDNYQKSMDWVLTLINQIPFDKLKN